MPLQSEEDVPLKNCSVGNYLPSNLEENADHSSGLDIDIDNDNAVSDTEHEMDSSEPLRLYPKRH